MPKKPVRKVLFSKRMKPVPKRIQGLRLRSAELEREIVAREHDIGERVLREMGLMKGKGSLPPAAIAEQVDWLVHNNRLREVKKEIKEWEKKNATRSRGFRAWWRIIQSPAKLRLFRLKNYLAARERIEKLEILKAFSKHPQMMSRHEKILFEKLKRSEKRDRALVDAGRKKN